MGGGEEEARDAMGNERIQGGFGTWDGMEETKTLSNYGHVTKTKRTSIEKVI